MIWLAMTVETALRSSWLVELSLHDYSGQFQATSGPESVPTMRHQVQN